MKTMRSIGLLLACTILSSCATKEILPPDTRVEQLRSIAFLPHYGASVDPAVQIEQSRMWGQWWGDIYKKTNWVTTDQVNSVLLDSNTLELWSTGEKQFMQTGIFSKPTITRVCEVLKTDGVLQGIIFNAQGGTGTSWFWGNPGVASSARLSLTLYSCLRQEIVWRSSYELTYSSGYTQANMIKYALSGMVKDIYRKTVP